MRVYECNNGKTYLAPDNSCLFCVHCQCFYDFTNGPYMAFCEKGHETVGQCDDFIDVDNNNDK
jgi:hypothetical protein